MATINKSIKPGDKVRWCGWFAQLTGTVRSIKDGYLTILCDQDGEHYCKLPVEVKPLVNSTLDQLASAE